MNREMYKKERQLSQQATEQLLLRGNHGTLSVNGDDGYPYAVPVNFVYVDGNIYIHSAKYGYKIDALKLNDKVCFSAIISANVLPMQFTAEFESVVAFGKASIIDNDVEKRKVLEAFIAHLTPSNQINGEKAIKAWWDKTAIIRINVESVTGKAYKHSSN